MLPCVVAMARYRLGGLIAVACAVLIGSSLVVGVAVLAESGIRSHVPVERYAAASVVLTGVPYVEQAEDIDVRLPDGARLSGALLSDVAESPGVDDAIAEVSYPAVVFDGDGEPVTADPVGHGWDSARLGDPRLRGEAPAADDELVLDSDVAAAAGADVGDTVSATLAGEPARYRVSGIVDAGGEAVYTANDTAAALAGNPDGEVDAILVTTTSDPDVVAARLSGLGDVAAYTGAARGDVEHGEAGGGTLIALSASMGGTIVMLVGFITAGALSVSAANQRRDLALLRAVGATPRQVRDLIANQATVVAVGAAIVGAPLGYLFAQGFATLLISAGMLPAALPLTFSPLPALIAALLLLTVVRVAARLAAMPTSRASATEAVAASRVEPGEPRPARTIAGCALIALALTTTVAPLFTASEAAFVSGVSAILLAMIGLALAAPQLVRTVTGWLARRQGPRGDAVKWLAVHNSHGYALRTAGAITVLALAVGLTVTQVSSQFTLMDATQTQRAEGMRADVVISAPSGMSSADAAEIAELSEVDAAVPMSATTMVWPYREGDKQRAEPYEVMALGPGAQRVVDPDVTAGNLDDLHGETVAMDSTIAWMSGLEVGDSVDLIRADGTPVQPTVVATYDRTFGFGPMVAASDLVAGHGAHQGHDAILVNTTAAGALDGWLRDHPDAGMDPDALGANTAMAAERGVNLVMSLVLLGYVLLGVGNRLVAATARRRDELATLRLIGASPQQLRRMIRGEATVTVGMAIGAGFALSVVPMSLLGLGILGLPWPQGPWWVLPGICGLVAAVAYAAMLIPTVRMMRGQAVASMVD